MTSGDAGDPRAGLPAFGWDYDMPRWTDGSTDEAGHLNWTERPPNNDEWDNVRMVTLNLDPNGEGFYRNVPISPDRPLDAYGSYDGQEDYYDLDDLAAQAFDAYGFEF